VTPVRVALTGGTGFLGTATLAALERLNVELTVGVHRRALLQAGQRVVPIEMETGRGFRPLVSGADILVHLATEISEDEARCEAIIARGTERLVTEAVDAGVGRLLYVSNAAIYGNGIYCGASETEVVVAPVTPISRARVAAEDAVLAAGGVVLRPLFVYGAGDARFIPSLTRGIRRLPFLPNGGRALLGTIAVHDLAAVICRMVSRKAWESGVYHATDDQPASLAAIVQALADAGLVRAPRLSLPYGIVRTIVPLLAPGVLGQDRRSASSLHRLFLVSHDHAYDSKKLWASLGLERPPSILEQLRENAWWYASRAQSKTGWRANA
jgi:nucleoside-diphosphate-sugar epimerase